jgi:cytosine/adenosine deaminase-related metal-dependent hydrolase
MNLVRARAVWTGEAWLDDATVVLNGHHIVEVRPARSGDGAALDGLLMPGLINAHGHLELAGLADRVQPAPDFLGWARGLMTARESDDTNGLEAATQAAVRALVDAGTAAVVDVSNGGQTAETIAGAGLVGIVEHEVLGFHEPDLAGRLHAVQHAWRHVDGPAGRVHVRPSPHAPYSTPPALIVAAAQPGPVPASIHLAEDLAELEFLQSGTGPFADFLDHIRRDWRWWRAPGLSPVRYLDSLGVLGPDLLLVHGRHIAGEDLPLVVERGASVCVCPRSNLHIGQQLPDVPGLVSAGVRLLLGTDSLASCPDVDVLEEVAVLVHAFPELDPRLWLRAVTADAADALGLHPLGRLVPGTAPGVLFLDSVGSPSGLGVAASRTWVVRPVVVP